MSIESHMFESLFRSIFTESEAGELAGWNLSAPFGTIPYLLRDSFSKSWRGTNDAT